jgi:hypothetical protein
VGCNLWSGYCEADTARKRTGEACAADSDCESWFCLLQADSGYPGGYCMSFCLTNAKVCPGDGVCYFSATGTSNFAYCYDGCAGNTDCRVGESYGCYSFSSAAYTSPVNACLPSCNVKGQSCTVSTECCAGMTCVTSGTAKVCQ